VFPIGRLYAKILLAKQAREVNHMASIEYGAGVARRGGARRSSNRRRELERRVRAVRRDLEREAGSVRRDLEHEVRAVARDLKLRTAGARQAARAGRSRITAIT